MKNVIFSLAVLFCLFLAGSVQGQVYQTAIGARLGSPLSASIKHFLNESSALEGYVGIRPYSGYSWFAISGAYQVHKPIPSVEGLQWYFGGGASVYFWTFDFATDASTTTLGIQGYLGLDYTFGDIPLNLSIDWIPTLFFGSYLSSFGAGYGSLGVRYVLSR